MPLLDALAARATSRAFAETPLPLQTLSDLLWAANGVNRPSSGKRTAPTARDWREIDVYVTLPQGLYRFDPSAHRLVPLVARDLRALTGKQDFVAAAPVTLVFVADFARMKDAAPADKPTYAYADAAFVSQNVYLFCASAGLATGVRAHVDRAALHAAMGLGPDEHVIFAQSVGYPAP
jgi:SagB-type dehydrogenase family enzyme